MRQSNDAACAYRITRADGGRLSGPFGRLRLENIPDMHPDPRTTTVY